MPAQEAVVSVDAAYFNPASIGFLDNGFQLGFNWQVASQTRESKTEYAPLAYGVKNGGSSSKLYKGEAFAPIVPSLDLAYVKDRWFVSDHFGVTGGGGKAEYANGLGSFESQVAGLAALLNTYPIPGAPFLYDVDMFLNGTQYSFSNQITGGFKLTDNLSVSAGVRMTYVQASYEAEIKNITINGTPAGAGLKFLVTDNLDLNVGYFHSFFDHVEKTTASTPETKEDFFRTSKAFGAGINFRF